MHTCLYLLLGIVTIWRMLDAEGRSLLMQKLGGLASSKYVTTVEMTTHGMMIAGGIVAGVYLSYRVVKIIHKWYTGVISGKRCAKDIIDLLASTAGAAAGAAAGGAIGMASGPIGGFIGKAL